MISQEEIRLKEMELEEISKKVEKYTPQKNIPIFEVFISIFSLAMSVVLFLFPSIMFVEVYSNGNTEQVYGFLLNIVPQYVYGIAFFVGAMFKAFGLLFSKNYLRVIGLCFSVVLYLLFAICLMLSNPGILMILFIDLLLFTIISIPLVKTSSISTRIEETSIEQLPIEDK